jgi:aldehyde dehydrogenase (NAD+)
MAGTSREVESRFLDAKRVVEAAFDLREANPGIYAGGVWAEAGTSTTLESFSPINGLLLGAVAQADAGATGAAVAHSLTAASAWAEVPAPKRGEIVAEIGRELAGHKDELGLLVSLEAGKTLSEGRGEVQEMVDLATFAAGLSRQLYGVTMASERPHHRMYEQWGPLGSVAVITAFNFPCAVWSWNAFIAAVVGDAVVWKPSSSAPLTAMAVTKVAGRVLERHSLPPIFTLVVGGGGEVGSTLLEDRRLPLVSFTGSVATGRQVAEVVARRLGKTLLELGGNNGVIVSDKADLDMALKGVAFGALATAGQRCTSTRRLLVQERVYATFVERLVGVYRNVRIGDPLLPGTLVGPLIDGAAVDTYLAAVDRTVEEGGRLLYGGRRLSIEGCERGHYVLPALAEAHPGMSIVQEETFGPLLHVMRYRDLDEALSIHNAVPQGLCSALFTIDLREEEYFLSHKGSDCGIVNVNTSTTGAEIGGAFGGEKDTGGGRESGSDAWKAYARRQTVSINHGADLPLAQGVEFSL